MSYDPGAIEAALSAAAGNEPQLVAELRMAFFEGAEVQLAAMRRARDPVEWRAAAARMNGLAASFGAVRLMGAAAQAMRADRIDGDMLRRIERTLMRLHEEV
jgi:histidine phosphotransfer protein HptB